MALGTVIFAGFGYPYIEIGGKRGSPLNLLKADVVLSEVV